MEPVANARMHIDILQQGIIKFAEEQTRPGPMTHWLSVEHGVGQMDLIELRRWAKKAA